MLMWSGFAGTYRAAFKIALRNVWYAYKAEADERAYLATLPPIPSDVAERASELRDMAWGCRIDGPGNEMHAALMGQAQHLIDTARGLN